MKSGHVLADVDENKLFDLSTFVLRQASKPFPVMACSDPWILPVNVSSSSEICKNT